MRGGISFLCPGCGEAHSIYTDEGTRPRWSWDGDVENPTVSPSILVTVDFPPEDGGPIRCHSFVRRGSIQFLNDCTHALRGQTVALPDWPGNSE